MTARPFAPQLRTLASSAEPSAEERDHYRRRVALFGKIALAFIGANFVIRLVVSIVDGSIRTSFTDSFAVLTYSGLAIFGVAWAATRSTSVPWRLVRAIDAGAMILYGVAVAVNCWPVRDYLFALPILSVPVTFAVLTRAVIVPDRALRTAWISIAHQLPLLVVGPFVLFREDAPPGLADFSYVDLVVRALLAAALATVISFVIHGLVRRVRQAQQLGQYRLEEKIGEGGMGQVYRASHALLRRPTAIKLLATSAGGEVALARFEREVQLTSGLTHPNTIAVYDFGHTPDGMFYYAMEFLEGASLEDIVARSGPLPPGRVIHILRQVCGSLGEAHDAGLIHRDVKPANLMLCRRGGMFDFVKVVDFGLVKQVEEGSDPSVTDDGVVTGTPLYMPPEAVSSPADVDSRGDLYSLGCVGYYLVTGEPVFEGASAIEVCTQHYSTSPTPPSERVSHSIPSDLEAVILSCLAKDPAARPQNARELADALAACGSAGDWTQEQAREEWAVHDAGATAGIAPREPEPTVPDSGRTVEVDYEGRF